MKKPKLDFYMSLSRQRSIQILIGVVLLYILMLSLEFPFVFKTGFSSVTEDGFNSFFNDAVSRPFVLESEEELEEKEAPIRPFTVPLRVLDQSSPLRIKSRIKEYKTLSSLDFDRSKTSINGFSGIQKSAKEAFEVGKKLWIELESGRIQIHDNKTVKNQIETCPNSILLSGSEFEDKGRIMVLPCGLTLGSHITLVGKPKQAHPEHEPKISLLREGQYVMVSQFMMELQGLKTVDGEDPPRVLHFNPRLKGDWTGKPVIEQNTCYRMQWGSALRCEGWKSKADEETVDGQLKCEKWIRDDDDHSEEVKAIWWLNRLIGRTKKVTVDWPYPFAEEKLFVLTLSAGFEGYHVNVDARHVTSFPYRTGFTLEDATGLSLNGDIYVHSIFAASLPTSHPSFSPQRLLDMSTRWKAPPLPHGPVELFIGILSAGNHFVERMAVRKSWMQHKLIKSSNVVARFFVALVGEDTDDVQLKIRMKIRAPKRPQSLNLAVDLPGLICKAHVELVKSMAKFKFCGLFGKKVHARKEVNMELKKEAEFFGDIVIVPYMDNYDLVVLKTVAICEYGVYTASAKYIMKCDDDTFVRVDAVNKEANEVADGKSLYVGNINYFHKPLRDGKWAVTYEEWPEEDYPPYANGPGYVVSSDIARFIVSEFKQHKLRLFKMEDVSMGMWVGQFNSSRPVKYIHSFKFCQFGCIDDYYTAHYQSPRQMICMWNKLQQQGRPQCCNMR